MKFKSLGLLLALAPLTCVCASCGSVKVIAVYNKDAVADSAKCGDDTEFSRICSFSFISVEGSKTVTKDAFTAVLPDGTKVTAKYLVSRPYGSLYDLKCDIISERKVPADDENNTYVAYEGLISKESHFYINGSEITTDYTEISI